MSAAICQYGTNKIAGTPPWVTLTGGAASGLAAVLNSAGPVLPSARHCAQAGPPDPAVQAIIFGYADGPDHHVAIASAGCDPGLVVAGRRAGELPFQLAADLFAYSTITTLRGGSAPAPDLIGLSATAAVARARRQHYSVGVDGAVTDLTVPPGTVVFQSLPAGARGSGPGGSVAVLLSTRPAAPCAASQLGLTYLGGGESAGNDFGTLLIRDTSARPCTLTGPLRVAGLRPGGRPDTRTGLAALQGVAVLTPGAGPVRWRPPGVLSGTRPGELTGTIPLMSEYRDGPATVDRGLCEPLWVVPATWRVTVPAGGVLTVANADSANRAGLVRSGGFVTCRGRLGIPGPVTVGSP